MPKLAWYYHRKSCQTCQKSDDYLDRKGIAPEVKIDCKKEPMTFDEAKNLLKGVQTLYATKGTKVIETDLRGEVDDSVLESLLIGPSGKLRAPSLRTHDAMIVGFNEEMYNKALRG